MSMDSWSKSTIMPSHAHSWQDLQCSVQGFISRQLRKSSGISMAAILTGQERGAPIICWSFHMIMGVFLIYICSDTQRIRALSSFMWQPMPPTHSQQFLSSHDGHIEIRKCALIDQSPADFVDLQLLKGHLQYWQIPSYFSIGAWRMQKCLALGRIDCTILVIAMSEIRRMRITRQGTVFPATDQTRWLSNILLCYQRSHVLIILHAHILLWGWKPYM